MLQDVGVIPIEGLSQKIGFVIVRKTKFEWSCCLTFGIDDKGIFELAVTKPWLPLDVCVVTSSYVPKIAL